MKSNNRERWIEILAVVITGLLKYILVDWINLKLFYITGVCLFWIAFIIMKYRRNHDVLKDWGFQRAHFSRSFLFLLPFALVTSTIIILYGIKANLALINWHIIPILVFYPVWGLVQQFMMIGLISRNMKIIYSQRLDQVHIVLITSLFFALVHIPSYPLVAYAFFMELLFTYAYFKWKNLWSLGLVHGWISGLLYFFVLGRDMWDELFMIF